MLLRVHAASLFIGDWFIMTGLPYAIRPRLEASRAEDPRRGQDVAGCVEAVGKDVTRLKPGDDVLSLCDGAFAEYATARQDAVALKPANLASSRRPRSPSRARPRSRRSATRDGWSEGSTC
jgi:NADPH:quinone reductase-like Zn-dependent oxidoreductase